MNIYFNLNKESIIFIIIIVIHLLLINGVEKQSIGLIWKKNKNVYRPNRMKCLFDNNDCLGMPSGHAEFVTFIALYLVTKNNKFPVYYAATMFILIISIQRILSKRHNTLQIIVGILLACLYYTIYSFTNFSLISLGICLLIIMFYSIIIERLINKQIRKPIPKWINKDIFPKIKEKQNSLYTIKLRDILFSSLSIFHSKLKLFIDWKDLEIIMDNLIDKIKKQNIKYTGIVGIKTGGAILSDYISKKMGIKNYKIKLSQAKNKCKSGKKSADLVNTYLLKKKESLILCEDTMGDVSNQNLILVDEVIASGNTMQYAINHLYKEKKAKYVYPVCLSENQMAKQNMKYKVDVLLDYHIIVWPWGYEN
jgi:hypoxanthine phosphoribosyltransferase